MEEEKKGIAKDDAYLPKNFLTVKNLILAIITIATGFNTLFSIITKDKLDIQAKELDNVIKKKEFENNLRFKIYDEVKDVLYDSASKKQDAVRIIISVMLADDSSYRSQMETLLLRNPLADTAVVRNIIKENVAVTTFLAESDSLSKKQTVSPTSTIGSELFRIDVFYLNDVKDAYRIADKVVNQLTQRYPNYDIRKRSLPSSINARKGYRITSNQIRFDENEVGIAQDIQKILIDSKIFSLQNPQLSKVRNETKNYVSVFVRNN